MTIRRRILQFIVGAGSLGTVTALDGKARATSLASQNTSSDSSDGTSKDWWIEQPGFASAWLGASTDIPDNAPSINAAASYARSNGMVLRAKSAAYHIKSKIILSGPCELSGTTFVYSGPSNGIAVEYSSGTSKGVRSDVPTDYLRSQNADLPQVKNANKNQSGWEAPGVSGTVGIRVVGNYEAHIRIPHIEGFNTGLLLTSFGSEGVASGGHYYSTYYLGNIQDNKVNIDINPALTGSVNELTFIGGRLWHNSAEGLSVQGVRHIRISKTCNNHRFFGLSIEGDTPEHHIEDNGTYNHYYSLRYEGARVSVDYNGGGACFFGGYGVAQIHFSGSKLDAITVLGADLAVFAGSNKGPLVRGISSFSADDPVFASYDYAAPGSALTDNAHLWIAAMTGNGVVTKGASDPHPSALISKNGQLHLGTGLAPIKTFPSISGEIGAIVLSGGDLRLHEVAGKAGRLRWNNAFLWIDREQGRLRTNKLAPKSDIDGIPIKRALSGPSSNRPMDGVAGDDYFDTTLGKPIFHNGHGQWVDANGKAV